MPKILSNSQGCIVVGRWLTSDGVAVAGGSITVTPRRGGTWRGMVISEKPITVKTGPGGHFRVALVPSSVVGDYRFQIGTLVFSVTVPDSGEVDFESIAKEAK